MSVKVMSVVWERSQMEACDRLVLLALADWSNDDGVCWPSLSQIQKKSLLSRQGVLNAIERCIAAGELQRVTKGHVPSSEELGHEKRIKQSRNSYRILLVNVVDHQLVNVVDQHATSGSQNDASQVVKMTRKKPAHNKVLNRQYKPSVQISADLYATERPSKPDLVPPPQIGNVYNGYPRGEGPPSRTAARRAKLHEGHAFCNPTYCVTAALHEKNLQRMRTAGLNLDDFDLPAWYHDAIAAMAQEGTSEPGLWLYKRLTSAIDVSVREG